MLLRGLTVLIEALRYGSVFFYEFHLLLKMVIDKKYKTLCLFMDFFGSSHKRSHQGPFTNNHRRIYIQ